MPQINDFVPSIGSSTQTYSASRRSTPNSSPTMPCSGNVRLIRARMAASAARSAAVTGSKPPERLLFSMPSALRKNGLMVSPEMAASSSTKAVKSIAVITAPAVRAYTPLCAAALRRVERPYGIRNPFGRTAYSGIGEDLSERDRLDIPSILAHCPTNMHSLRKIIWGKSNRADPITLEFCAAQGMLLQCGNERVSPVTVALLGRFLPRLGPLPQGERPFFLSGRAGLFSGGAIRTQFLDWDLDETVGQYFEFLRKLGKGSRGFVSAFIHVERAVDLKLNGVQPGGRVAVMLGNEAARIWLIAAHGVAKAAHALLDCFRHDADTASAVAITEHEIGARTLITAPGA